MFKKLILLLGCVSLFVLVACGEENNSTASGNMNETSESAVLSEFEITIEMISDAELEDLMVTSDHTYINYGAAREWFITEGINLLFHFDQSVTEFSLITVAMLEDGTIAKTGVIQEIGALRPDKPLVITHYLGNGTTPDSGFYFVDSNGVSNWFVFHLNQMDGGMSWSPFHWSHDYDLFVLEEENDNDDLFGMDLPDITDIDGMMPIFDPINTLDIEISITQMTTYEAEGGGIDFQNTIQRYLSNHALTYMHLLDYNDLIHARDGGVALDRDTDGDFLLIQTSAPVYDFAVILMGHDVLEEGSLIYIPIESFNKVNTLNPEEGFVIHAYLSRGTIPWSGITFLDVFGVRHYYAIMQDQSGLREPYFLLPFENRTDELPSDWQPWW